MGKGWTGYVVCKGNLFRTCRAGENKQTSLQRIANRFLESNYGSEYPEEPGAGIPQAGICAGGVG
jgi:hypothetical protein